MKNFVIITLSILVTLTNFAADEESDFDINRIDPLIFNINRIGPGASILDPESKDLITTFKVIQRIYALAAQIAKIPGVCKLPPLFKDIRDPLPQYNQTEQGIYLIVGSTPEALSTPWGEVPFPDLITCDMWARVFDEFRERLRLEFVENSGEHETINHKLNFNVEHYLEEEYGYGSSKEDLDYYRGSDKRITANYCGYYSFYKILTAFSISLPEPKRLAKENFRKDTIVKENWNIMTKRYEQEKNKNASIKIEFSR